MTSGCSRHSYHKGMISEKAGSFHSSEHESPNYHLGPRFWPVELGLRWAPAWCCYRDGRSQIYPQPRSILLILLEKLSLTSTLKILFHSPHQTALPFLYPPSELKIPLSVDSSSSIFQSPPQFRSRPATLSYCPPWPPKVALTALAHRDLPGTDTAMACLRSVWLQVVTTSS